jgi:hypothetical protein
LKKFPYPGAGFLLPFLKNKTSRGKSQYKIWEVLFMESKLRDFPRKTLPASKGLPKITLIIVPRGNSWHKFMNIDAENIKIFAGKIFPDVPANTIFASQELVESPTGPVSLKNAFVYALIAAMDEKKEMIPLGPDFLSKDVLSEIMAGYGG